MYWIREKRSVFVLARPRTAVTRLRRTNQGVSSVGVYCHAVYLFLLKRYFRESPPGPGESQDERLVV